MTTVKELYEWAKNNNYENLPIELRFDDIIPEDAWCYIKSDVGYCLKVNYEGIKSVLLY